MQPFSINTLKMIGLFGLMFILLFFLPKINIPLLNIFFRAAFLTIIFGSLVLWTKVSPDINTLVFKLISIFKK